MASWHEGLSRLRRSTRDSMKGACYAASGVRAGEVGAARSSRGGFLITQSLETTQPLEQVGDRELILR